jgi:oxidase EvaA
MIVETYDDVPPDPDFCWLTLGQIGELLQRDDVVNMDARTVLACAPTTSAETRALHSDTDLLSWLTAERARRDVHARLVPLAQATDWTRDDWSVTHAHESYFRVVAVEVEAGNREVTRWTQPLVEPLGPGVAAFLVRHFDGVPHLLAHARVEGGLVHSVEVAPTVQCLPLQYSHLIGGEPPPFLDVVLRAAPERIRYEAVHGEEGGRFLEARSRYLLVEAREADAPADPPPGYRWVTPGQLSALVQHSHHVNVQARTLLSVVTTGTVRL